MNWALQNIVAVALIIAAVIVGTYFLFSRQQGQYIPPSWGELGCVHPVYIRKDSLQPTLQQGTIFSMNQCITDSNDFSQGDILYFEYENENMLGIVDSKSSGYKNIVYTVDIGLDGKIEISADSVIAFSKLPSEE